MSSGPDSKQAGALSVNTATESATPETATVHNISVDLPVTAGSPV